VGLLVILHSDVDMPFAKAGAEPVFLTQMKDLLRRHPKTTIIWAHIGLGRVVHPVQGQATPEATERNPTYAGMVEAMAADPGLSHVYFDISWDEVAKYAVSSPEAIANTTAMLNKYPDRFLFGTDNVAPADQAAQLRVYDMWAPIWAKLTPEASLKIRKGNYERLFDAARARVRTWEAANVR
jgi:predicted TIM-barrel fold metal-dependent hydrolase